MDLESKLLVLNSKLFEAEPLSVEEKMQQLELLREVLQLSVRKWSKKEGNPPERHGVY
jgi:hypothetical protein